MKNEYFLPVFSEFLSENELKQIININEGFLEEIGVKRISEQELFEANQVCYFITTGGTEQQILDLQKERNSKFSNEEIVLLAHASHNSLPACLEILAKLQQDGIKGKIIYLPEKLEIDNPITNIQTLNGKGQLSGCRIGEVGAPSDWLVASSPTHEIVKKNWGAEVIKIEILELKELYSQITEVECRKNFKELTGKSQGIVEPSNKDIINNIKVYLALKELVKKYELDAVTLRCFDLVIDLETTGCFALSRLNDEGIIAGCEGDMISTLGMLLVYKKTGRLPWMANPSRLELENNSLLIAHCTVPRTIVKHYIIRSHFESRIGVGIQGTFPTGDVTIFRIGGIDLDKVWLATGKIISTSNDKNLCRTQIEIKLSSDYSVNDLLIEPLGNHLIVVPGIFNALPIV